MKILLTIPSALLIFMVGAMILITLLLIDIYKRLPYIFLRTRFLIDVGIYKIHWFLKPYATEIMLKFLRN